MLRATRQVPVGQMESTPNPANITPSPLDLVDPNGKQVVINILGRSGLVNLGSTCYFNSIVQCLGALTHFRSYLISGTFIPVLWHNITKSSPGKSGSECFDMMTQTVTFQLAMVLRLMWSQNRVVSPTGLKNIIDKRNGDFNNNQRMIVMSS